MIRYFETRDFVATAKAERVNHFIQVRDVRLSRELKVSQLRTKKNTYLAAAWDVLGNVTILDRQGRIRNLTEAEYDEAK